ncbi:aromatic amino acid aminotransferase [Saccharospirillum sp. MSK14-1]|uniref:amino acid aminotransferase n=1 Tax=Saccharospirillum sp. MSK14-1 TaxID=1897632 RepID=UPI000D34D575|nr:amino acid aminotransferase [Saccharospirillum sp. MSK14-1]PTY36978.1 aromatic amino acid aminotransferase [Saccharospirillum sp. MSK14-1]
MFSSLATPKADPILSLSAFFKEDPRPHKIDLGIGVYRNSEGVTPIMSAVRKAMLSQAETQPTKAYIGLAGNETFNQAMTDLLLSGTASYDRASAIQTPGASGALRMLADLIASIKPNTTVWISRPSYVNHQPVMEAAGLTVREYPFFDAQTKRVDETAMLAQIAELGPDDVLLLHGCCHNPTGGDISLEAWREIANLALRNGFLPFVDIAYQGFGDGLMEDAAGLRLLADSVPQLLISTSCSKNFGLYRERTGAAIIIADSKEATTKARGRALELARGTYSMPPDHGADIVANILGNEALKAEWLDELASMNQRINRLREQLTLTFREQSDSQRFDYFSEHRGMFSVTGLDNDQIAALRNDHGVYVVGGGRVNVAGMKESDIPAVVNAFLAVNA